MIQCLDHSPSAHWCDTASYKPQQQPHTYRIDVKIFQSIGDVFEERRQLVGRSVVDDVVDGVDAVRHFTEFDALDDAHGIVQGAAKGTLVEERNFVGIDFDL